VLQYNKRDLRNVASVGEMDKSLNFLRVPTYEAVAPAGKGVTETLVAISRRVFANLRKTLLMPGEMAAHEDIGELADARIQKTFSPQEAEALEEISEVEEIRVLPASAPAEVAAEVAAEAVRSTEVEMEPTSLRKAEAPRPAPVEFREVGEIEVEAPDPAPPPPPVAPAPHPPSVSVEAEEFGEIEVEVPEPAPIPPPVAPAPHPPSISVEVEGGGLTFLKFETPAVTKEGHAVLPALFLDAAGNPVRLRIRISMEEDLH